MAGATDDLQRIGLHVIREHHVVREDAFDELAPHRVMRVHDIVQPGQEVQVLILSADPQARRISLSLKGAAKQQEAPETAEAEEPQAPEKSKPQKPIPLRGGIGQQFTLPESLASGTTPSDENDNES